MKSHLILLFMLSTFLFLFIGCDRDRRQAAETAGSATQGFHNAELGKKIGDSNEGRIQKVSFDQSVAGQSATSAIDRKILKDANVTIEVGSPVEAQRQVRSCLNAFDQESH